MPTIIPKDDADSKRLARDLLGAAGDRPERVQTITVGQRMAYVVDDDLAAQIGTADYVPEPVPVKPTAKKAAPRKTSPKSSQ